MTFYSYHGRILQGTEIVLKHHISTQSHNRNNYWIINQKKKYIFIVRIILNKTDCSSIDKNSKDKLRLLIYYVVRPQGNVADKLN